MISFVTTLLNALAAIPTLINAVESFAGAVVLWYCSRQKGKTLSAISDAIALDASASSDDDRFNAMDNLQKALSAPRISAN